jgi:hypothetical protein
MLGLVKQLVFASVTFATTQPCEHLLLVCHAIEVQITNTTKGSKTHSLAATLMYRLATLRFDKTITQNAIPTAIPPPTA